MCGTVVVNPIRPYSTTIQKRKDTVPYKQARMVSTG